MKVIYASREGGKPLNIGINRAKRVAASADKRDRAIILQQLGTGLPKRDAHHSTLVRSRHRYYHEAHDEFVKSRTT